MIREPSLLPQPHPGPPARGHRHESAPFFVGIVLVILIVAAPGIIVMKHAQGSGGFFPQQVTPTLRHPQPFRPGSDPGCCADTDAHTDTDTNTNTYTVLRGLGGDEL